jgi:hypothetical protein
MANIMMYGSLFDCFPGWRKNVLCENFGLLWLAGFVHHAGRAGRILAGDQEACRQNGNRHCPFRVVGKAHFARRGCRLQAVVNGMRDRGLAPLASPQDGMGQKKVLPTAFLQAWPPRVNHRFGSGSDVTTSKKGAFQRFCGDFVLPRLYSASTKGIAHTDKTAGKKRLTL